MAGTGAAASRHRAAAAVAARRPARGARPVHRRARRPPGPRLRHPRAARRGQDPAGRPVPRPGRPRRPQRGPGHRHRRVPSRRRSGRWPTCCPPGIADERCDLVAVMSEVRPVLRDADAGGPLVLFVDDLHLLDATSATLVGQLVDADLVFLVATVRSDARVPAGVDALWHRGPGAPRRPRRPRPRRGRHAAAPGAAGPGRGEPRSPRSGRPARATSCSCASWCSAPSTAATSSTSGACGGSSARWSPRPGCASWSPPASAPRPPATEALDILAVWEPAGPVGPRGDRRAPTSWRCSTAHGLLDGADRRAPPAGAPGPSALRRDPPGPHARPDPPPAAAGARRPHRGLGRPPPRGRHPGRHRPAGRARGRPTPSCWSGPPAWPATARTSRRSSGWAGPRCADGITPEAGLLLGEALHELGRVRRGRRGARPRPRRRWPATTSCSSTSPRSAPGT